MWSVPSLRSKAFRERLQRPSNAAIVQRARTPHLVRHERERSDRKEL